MRKKISANHYHFFVAGKKVVAVSSYAGQTVRGVAICSEADAFDLQKGKELAAARCSAKIARKRYDWACIKQLRCRLALGRAERECREAERFCSDSLAQLDTAHEKLNELEQAF